MGPTNQKTEQELQAAGKHGELPTTRIKANNEQGFAVINTSDFDKEKHEKHVDAAEAVEKTEKKSKK